MEPSLLKLFESLEDEEEEIEENTKLKGFVEIAFSSATPKKEVALGYAGKCTCAIGAARDGGSFFCEEHRSTLFQIEIGQVDRGADLRWVSQFPTEHEHTLLPLSNFEVTDMHRERHVNVVEMKLNSNLSAMTIDELKQLRQKKCVEFACELCKEGKTLLQGISAEFSVEFERDCKRLIQEIRHPLESCQSDCKQNHENHFNNPQRFRDQINKTFHDWQNMMFKAAQKLQEDAHASLGSEVTSEQDKDKAIVEGAERGTS